MKQMLSTYTFASIGCETEACLEGRGGGEALVLYQVPGCEDCMGQGILIITLRQSFIT